MDKLTGADYATRPIAELINHPDYSPHARRVVQRVLSMNTSQLENLNLVEAR